MLFIVQNILAHFLTYLVSSLCVASSFYRNFIIESTSLKVNLGQCIMLSVCYRREFMIIVHEKVLEV